MMIDNIKVCVMRGFYDEKGEYREEYFDDVALSELPEKAVARIAPNYDLSILYSKYDVLVIAKSKQDIEEHKRLEGTPQFFHRLLHNPIHSYYDGYMCMAINLESLRRCLKRNRNK